MYFLHLTIRKNICHACIFFVHDGNRLLSDNHPLVRICIPESYPDFMMVGCESLLQVMACAYDFPAMEYYGFGALEPHSFAL